MCLQDRISAVKVKRGQVYQTKYGAFPHNDMIGKPYGSKV
jgi:tRNA (adenine57-N1/adenine58-N1)-methyltransferase